MTLSVGSTFSGIEGFGVGFARAGMGVDWHVETNPQCRELLEKMAQGTPVYDDVRTVHGQGWCGEGEGFPTSRCDRCLPGVDVLCGGFPCQDISVAGRRAGLAGERSGLFWEFARLAAEIAPRWLVIENVPGLLSSCGCDECSGEDDSPLALGEDGDDDGERVVRPDHRGRDMAVVIGTLTELGYGVAWRVLDAQYFGLAQRRERVFIVGCLGDPARAAQVLLEPESCGGDPAPSRKTGQDVAGALGGGSGSRGFCDDLDRSGAFIPEIAHSLRAQGQLAHREDVAGSPDRNQGVHVLSMGNEVAGPIVPVLSRCLTARQNRDDGESQTFVPEVAVTLTGGSARSDGVNAPGRRQEDDTNLIMSVGLGSDPLYADNLAQLITGRNGDPGVVAYPLAMRGRSDGAELEMGEEGVYNTLRAGDGGSSRSNWVAFSENQRGEVLETDYAHQLTAGGGKPGQGYPAVRQEMAVRRLTPRECERLQGFDDDWTVAFPDSTRYRMLGNAVPTPVTQWIGKRIVALA